MSKGKFYWHIHHDTLLGWSDNIEERIAYIKQAKSAEEIPPRLKLLKPVRGKLPGAVIKAGVAYDKARAAHDEALATYCKAQAARFKAQAACKKAWAACYKAAAAYDKAWAAHYKARDTYREALADHQEEIEALHRQECPGCSWDGETIFSGKEGKG